MEKTLNILVSVACLAFGLFVYLRPAAMIDIQKRFYEKINWKIEPISMPKEIRNTKVMGLFLVLFVFGVAIYSFFKKG